MKRKHKPSDKAARLAEIISLKPPAPVEQPADKDFAAILKDMSFHISISGRKERKKNE
ncbi:MAG: hypothetical protein IJ121_02885 [Eubacterium sp.]|nr:hypothetical protein [Eubacterium sp.]